MHNCRPKLLEGRFGRGVLAVVDAGGLRRRVLLCDRGNHIVTAGDFIHELIAGEEVALLRAVAPTESDFGWYEFWHTISRRSSSAPPSEISRIRDTPQTR
ncbi:hypothetical protein XU06_29710 (plasmid) [Rhodococcus erythropolis]|nr:hypothetical protein XU06_29710 [Rhodococcus erythropolis]